MEVSQRISALDAVRASPYLRGIVEIFEVSSARLYPNRQRAKERSENEPDEPGES